MSGQENKIEALARAGIRFLVNARVPGGGRDLLLSAKEVEGYLVDRDASIAAQFGATKEEYLTWVESDGDVQCAATTAAGHRCKNFVSGGGQMDFDDWKKARGGFCATHGGEGSSHKR